MNPDRYLQAEDLFIAALEISPEEREAFLAGACDRDPELKVEVESLLAAHLEQGGFLDKPPLTAAYGMLAKMDSVFSVNSVIGPYRILGLLGRGGMGEVYLAEDGRLDRRVALKLLPPHFTGDADRLRRFIKEAKAASSLNHPNIITIHEIGQEAGAHFIATEYVEGQTLRQQIQSLSLYDALEIAIQVAGALSAAQTTGIVHRDIKPENIMIRPDGLVKILDFGIAKLTMRVVPSPSTSVSIDDQSMTAPGLVIGTLQYMSPEQARGREVDARTDIFSLGVVIYEMVTGKAPFDGETSSDIIAAVLTADPEPINRHKNDVPPELQRIVTKALHKNIEERYQAARELLIDLKNFRQDLEIAARSKRTTDEIKIVRTTGEIRSGELVLEPERQRKLPKHLLWMAALGAIVIGTIVWWLVNRFAQADADFVSSLRPLIIYNQKSEPDPTDPDTTISPDGRMIAFSMRKGDERNIWLKLIAEGEPVEITKGNAKYFNPIWSPDGLQIAFVAQKGSEIGVWRMPAIGGTAKSVAILPAASMPVLKRWSKKSPILYFELDHNLYSFDLTSGRSVQITKFDPAGPWPRDFTVSPQEDRIAFIDRKENRIDLWAMDFDGKGLVQITRDTAEERRPAWAKDGERILYSSNRNGIFQVYLTPADRAEPLQITYGDLPSFVSDASADGSKIAYGGAKEEADIWMLNLESGEEFEISSSPGVEFGLNPSPDGRAVVFQAFSVGIFGRGSQEASVLIKPADPDGRQMLLVADGFDAHWSPDGARIAFVRKSGETNHLWSIKATGGDERQLSRREVSIKDHLYTATDHESGGFYSWSPDSTRVVYTSQEHGNAGVWIAPVDGSNERNLVTSENAGFSYQSPIWSSKGDQIAFVSTRISEGTNLSGVWIAKAETGEIKKLAETTRPVKLLGWGSGRNEVLYATIEKDPGLSNDLSEITINKVSAASASEQYVARISAELFRLRLSSDGRWLAYVSRQNGKENLWVLPVAGGPSRRVTSNTDPKQYLSDLAWSYDGKRIFFSKRVLWRTSAILDNFK